MKKKIIAAALALCLVLGLLPLSALAAQYKATLNGSEITIDVDDATGAVTLPAGLAEHYTASPDKLTIDTTTGKFPKTQEFTLHYNGAPAGITISGTLVDPAAQTFTVSFAAGGHATGEKAAETLTVPEGASSVEYTLPDETGFTPESGYVFSGWLVGSDTTAKAAGEKITVSADVTLTAQWEAEGEKVVTVTPEVDADGSATVDASGVNVTPETETVVLDLSSKESAAVTVKAGLVNEMKQNAVETVQVQTSLATAGVPVAALPASGDAKIAMTPAKIAADALPEGTADAVKEAVTNPDMAVSVTLADSTGKNLLPKKDSYAAGDPAITITINGLTTGKTYVVLCLSDGVLTRFGRFASIQGTSLSVKSRHLSDFIAVEETAENAAALAAVTADSGNAGAVTPPETAVKVESVKTDIAVFAKVKVSGMDENKVYLIVVGSIAKGSPQSNFVIDGADTHEFYCNTQGGKQTISVYEFTNKADIQSGDIAENLKLRADVAKVTE